MRKLIFCTTFLLGCLATTFAQDSLVVAKKASDRVQLFLDCTTWDCFDTYLKTEVQFVDFVRDRHLADVHIMITTQATGSGGTEYTLSFLGQDRFKDDNQTVRFFKKTTDSEQLEREGLSRTLKMGLLHYVAQTAMATEISVNYSKQSEETTAVKTDPWKNWVYSISLSGWTTGEARFNSLQTFGSLDADRVTEDWKINIGASFNYNESSFVISDGIFTSVNKGQYLYGSAVRSWGKKWAYGGKIRLAASSYSNVAFSRTVMPAIEYNIFPYSESTRRMFTLRYAAGYYGVNWIDTTLYNKINEHLWKQSFSAGYVNKQKWGSIELIFTAANYLHDFSKNNFSLSSNMRFNVAKGLSLNLGGQASIIHDQLGLRKEGASDQEVLLQQQQLATSYSYWCNFGITYQFGSIYNNVVNSRFTNGDF